MRSPKTQCDSPLARAGRSRARRVPPPKTYRFDARLNEDQKLLIQRAADLEPRTMTDFVLHSAETAAERTIDKRTMLILTARETEAFPDPVLHPPEARTNILTLCPTLHLQHRPELTPL